MRDDCDGSAIALRAAWRRLLQCARRGHSTNRLIIAADRPIFNRMIEYQPALDGLFHALSDPTRRAMLAALAVQERSVGELAAPFAITLAAASKHIRTLERAGLVKRKVQGRTHLCALDATPLAEADAWLRGFARSWMLQAPAGATDAADDRDEGTSA